VFVRRFTPSAPIASLSLAIVLSFAGTAAGQSTTSRGTASLTVSAAFAPRASVEPPSRVLRFEVTDASVPVEASIEFAVGARTRTGGHVVLLAEADMLVPEGLLSIAGSDGTSSTTMAAVTPAVVQRWMGSGLRTGRLVFRLRAAPGRYEVPVRLFVETP
jgi:hypothetical protein